ncbi:MAG: hypothetical protein AAF217_06635 [Pseudomonadota bacterium]
MIAFLARLIFSALVILASPSIGYAEDKGRIKIELNKVETVSENCLLSFVVSSKLPTDIEKIAYEFVIFDKEMRVERMTVFDFKSLPASKLKVRQFQLGKTKCDNLGRLLINDASSCTGQGIEPSICLKELVLDNRTEVEFLN